MRFLPFSSISAALLLHCLHASWTGEVDEITSEQHDTSSCKASALMQRSHQLALDDIQKPKDSKDERKEDSLGKKVYMDQKGFQKIVKLDDKGEMSFYVERIAEGLGLTVQDEKKLDDFSSKHLTSKKSANFTILVHDILDSFHKEKWLKSSVPKATGESAELTEDGYKAVLQHCSDKEMATFMKRYLCDKNLEVQNKGSLKGMAPFYSGSRSLQSFNRLKEEFKQLEGQSDSWLISKEPSKIKGCGPEKEEDSPEKKEDKDTKGSSESMEDAKGSSEPVGDVTDVTCDFTADNFVGKVYVDGKDKTGSLKGDVDDMKSKKTVKFKSDVSKIAFHVNDAEKGCHNGGFAISCSSKDPSWMISSNDKTGWKVFSTKGGWYKDELKKSDFPPEVDGKKWFEMEYEPGAEFSEPMDAFTEFSGSPIKTDGKKTKDLCGEGKKGNENHWFFIYTHE